VSIDGDVERLEIQVIWLFEIALRILCATQYIARPETINNGSEFNADTMTGLGVLVEWQCRVNELAAGSEPRQCDAKRPRHEIMTPNDEAQGQCAIGSTLP
jgi:hypothetical protein